MGGEALKDYGVVRKPRNEYFFIKNKVLSEFSKVPQILGLITPNELPTKEDFGDLDVLVAIDDTTFDLEDFIRSTFNPKVVLKNGTVWSYDYMDFQIDIIRTTSKYSRIYANYILNGDGSMVFGRIARQFGLKYGVYGLEFVVNDELNDHEVGTIEVCVDPEKCLAFLGYDYDTWATGFQNEQELTEFVFDSPYVTQDFLIDYSTKTKHRKRDKNRMQYKRMHAWFEKHKDRYPATTTIPHDERERLKIVDAYFPEVNLIEKYDALNKLKIDRQNARSKFSGSNIIELSKIHCKEPLLGNKLADFIASFDKRFENSEAKLKYILETDIKIIEEEYIKALKNIQNI